jgi:KDO2-lipid IV(A) lauroyltransferase
MPSTRHPVRAIVEWCLVFGLFTLLRLIPRRARLWLGKVLGLALYGLFPRFRRMAASNLDRAFGETRSREEKRRIARASFVYLGRMLCDMPVFYKIGPQNFNDFAVFEGLENIRGAYAKGGVFVFSGHYGHWEIVAHIQGYMGMPMAMVTRPLDNPHLEKILYRYRTLSGNQVVHKRGAAREMLRAIRRGWGVAIIIDQNVRGEDGLFVDFFGTSASTTPGLATLALKTGAPVVPAFCIPLPDGRYRIRYLPEVEHPNTGDTRQDILEFTQRCTSIIENQIREEPDFWVWVHRRWRTRPNKGSCQISPARAAGA